MEIKAIETRWKGYRFRSRLEARWAVFFEALGLHWEYEPEGFSLPSGPYLPDFRLMLMPDDGSGVRLPVWIEVKPFAPGTIDDTELWAGKYRELRRGHGQPVVLVAGVPGESMNFVFAWARHVATGEERPVMFNGDINASPDGELVFNVPVGDIFMMSPSYTSPFRQVALDEKTDGLAVLHGLFARVMWSDRFMEAVDAAKSARFEHGESPD